MEEKEALWCRDYEEKGRTRNKIVSLRFPLDLPSLLLYCVLPNTWILPAYVGEGQKLYITPLVHTLRNVVLAAKYTLKQLSKRHIYIYQCVPHD